MSKLRFTISENEEDTTVFGLRQKSSDKAQAKDIPALSRKYYEVVNKKNGGIIPFFVISKDYNENTKDFQLFVGGSIENDNLDTFVILNRLRKNSIAIGKFS